jgi:hypothetical protein
VWAVAHIESITSDGGFNFTVNDATSTELTEYRAEWKLLELRVTFRSNSNILGKDALTKAESFMTRIMTSQSRQELCAIGAAFSGRGASIASTWPADNRLMGQAVTMMTLLITDASLGGPVPIITSAAVTGCLSSNSGEYVAKKKVDNG